MLQTYENIDMSLLPKEAQRELYDFYLFLKQRYPKKMVKPKKDRRIERLNQLKVAAFEPLSRDEIYER